MSNQRVLKIFIAVPGDVEEEREIIRQTVVRVNAEASLSLGVMFEALEGTVHSLPGMARPQSHITPLVDLCDVFIGVLWTRFGTPPGKTASGEVFGSGTQEEFERALKRWEDNGGSTESVPRIMMYFSEVNIKPSLIEFAQFDLVKQFRSRFLPGGKHPGLYYQYQTPKDFQDAVRQHLFRFAVSYSPKLCVNQVTNDFVKITRDDWLRMLRSKFAYLFVMYAGTWRNTYLQQLRNIIAQGGKVDVVLPKPLIGTEIFTAMAARVDCTPTELQSKITEAALAFSNLGAAHPGSVQVRFSRHYYNHALYLFSDGGVVGLYSFFPNRAASPAIVLQKSDLHTQFIGEFRQIFDAADTSPCP